MLAFSSLNAVRQRRQQQQSGPPAPHTPHPALQHQTPARTQQIILNTPRPPPLQQPATPLPNTMSSGNNDPINIATSLATPARSQSMTGLTGGGTTGQPFIPPGKRPSYPDINYCYIQ